MNVHVFSAVYATRVSLLSRTRMHCRRTLIVVRRVGLGMTMSTTSTIRMAMEQKAVHAAGAFARTAPRNQTPVAAT